MRIPFRQHLGGCTSLSEDVVLRCRLGNWRARSSPVNWGARAQKWSKALTPSLSLARRQSQGHGLQDTSPPLTCLRVPPQQAAMADLASRPHRPLHYCQPAGYRQASGRCANTYSSPPDIWQGATNAHQPHHHAWPGGLFIVMGHGWWVAGSVTSVWRGGALSHQDVGFSSTSKG